MIVQNNRNKYSGSQDHALTLLLFFGSARLARNGLRLQDLLNFCGLIPCSACQQVCCISRSDKWHRVGGGLRGRE